MSNENKTKSLFLGTAIALAATSIGCESQYAREQRLQVEAHMQYAQKIEATPTEAAIGYQNPTGYASSSLRTPRYARFQVGSEPMQVSYDVLGKLASDSIDDVVNVLDKKANAKAPVTLYVTKSKDTTYLVKVEADGKAYGLRN